MTLKKFDLAKNLGLKINGQMRAAAIPGRFAADAAPLDKREQRRRDAAAGLVPFACKLPGDLVKRLNERAAAHEGGVNAWVAQCLEAGLAASDAPAAEALPAKPAKKAARKTAAKPAAE